MLSIFSFGMVSDPVAELGVRDTRPVNAEAKFLMENAQCAVWCSSNTESWNKKCGFASGYCAGCNECTTESTPNCAYWCTDHSESWATSARPDLATSDP